MQIDASDNIGHSGTVTLDGKYVLLFHNDSNSRKYLRITMRVIGRRRRT